jgi:hypothetical protein
LLFSNKSESVVLGQAGANSSLRFLGPVRGILPIGPNSLPGFDTLQPSPLSNPQTKAVMLSYNYTLDHQGFTNNISCVYDPQSPIRLWTVPDDPLMVASNASCDGIGLENFSNSAPDNFVAPDTDNTLTIWACKSKPTGEGDVAYYIYLRGPVYDALGHGNITCTVTPRPSIFPVTYQSSTGVFLTQERIRTSNPTTAFFKLVENAISGLPQYLSGQTTDSNLVANSVWNLGIQSLGLAPFGGQDDYYLPLYAAMIQGILVNEVCPASNSLLLSLMGVL